MEKELSLLDAIVAGMALGKLLVPPRVQGDVTGNSEQLAENLEKCGLPVSLAAMLPLKVLAETCPNPNGGVGADIQYQSTSCAHTIFAALAEEAGKTLVVKLQRSKISEQLLNLNLPLSDSQRVLHSECVRCLECGAYRSGIVMGWNLIYDYIRTWVAADQDRLLAFDAELAKHISHKGRQQIPHRRYKQISTYADFLGNRAPSERTVLDTLKKAQLNQVSLATEDVANHLIKMLNDRNNFAHASRREATISLANHYIEELIHLATEHFGS